MNSQLKKCKLRVNTCNMRSGIYLLRNNINGKVYIGQSKNIEKRLRRHELSIKYNYIKTYIKNAIKEYGWINFEKMVLEYCDTSLLNEREKRWIKLYNCANNEIGYNLTLGGQDGFNGIKMSDERKLNKPKLIGNKTSMFGKKHSDKTIKKMSEIGKIRLANGDCPIKDYVLTDEDN